MHEYGGGSYAVRDRTVYFTNWSDQRIYVQRDGGEPAPLTSEPSVPRGARFADLTITANGKYLLCVRETHTDDGEEAVNEIVAVDAGTGAEKVIATGRDFTVRRESAIVTTVSLGLSGTIRTCRGMATR